MNRRVAQGCILGARDTQEDAVLVVGDDQSGVDGDLLLVLADGMGGHSAGEIASETAIGVFARHFHDVATSLRPRERLKEALEAANDALAAEVAEAPELGGMGCTLIGALVASGRLVWVSVGDSVLFRLRDGEIKRLNEDHSVFGELMYHVRSGDLTLEEAKAHPQRHALRAALTGGEIAQIDLVATTVEAGDIVILASDGLETLEEAEIAEIVENAREAGPDDIVRDLLAAVEAHEAPRQDNASVIVLTVDAALAAKAGPVADEGEAKTTRPGWRTVAIGLTAMLGVAVAGASLFGAEEAAMPPVSELDQAGTQTAGQEATTGAAPAAGAEPADAGPGTLDASQVDIAVQPATGTGPGDETGRP